MKIQTTNMRLFINGQEQTVDTTCDDLEAIGYFINSVVEESNGSMTDKGKELIDQARETQLKNLETRATNSTRHKSQNGETHRVIPKVSPENLLQLHHGVEKKAPWMEQTEKQYRDSILGSLYISPLETQLLDSTTNNLTDLMKRHSEGYKETVGKTDYSEINLGILDLMAERFSQNKSKYPKGNTKKPLDKQEIVWAMFRHIKKMLQPQENDPETFKEHLSAVLTNCSIVLDQLELEK